MDDALLVRGFERLGDLPRDRQRLVERNRPAAMRSASVGPSTSSMTRARSPFDFLEAIDRARCCGWFSDASDLGFAFEAREAVGIARERVRAGP